MSQIYQYLYKSLKNIFVCRKLRNKGELDYPNCILPKRSLKVEINFDDLISSHSIFVLRRSDLHENETFHTFNDGTILLNDDAIDNKRIPNLSLNLMGGFFENIHSIYVPINDGANRWQGEKIYLYEHLNDYKIDNVNGLIFINANDLHNKSIPYYIPSNNNLHKEIRKFEKIVGISENIVLNTPPNEIELKGKTYFKHDPVKLNYWHVELIIQDFKNIPLKKVGNSSNEIYVEELFTNWIKVNSYPNLTSFDKINKKHYSA